MRCLPPRVNEIPDTFFADLTRANDSQASCESAELFWGRFEQASKILALWSPGCACAASQIGLTKFPRIFFADLTRANDSEACCVAAELFWGRFEEASKILARWGPAYACAASHLGLTQFSTLFFADLSGANDSQASCESAKLLGAGFEQATKIVSLWGPTCECAASLLGFTKFPTRFFADLMRANASQFCCGSAELFWGRFEEASKSLALFCPTCACAASHLGLVNFPKLFSDLTRAIDS